VSSDELIKVSSTLAQAGLSAKDAQKALQALALTDLAPSFDSLNETVEGSIALMRQFGVSAGELQQALGAVNAVAAAFAVESSDLIAAIQRTGGVFAAASRGVSEGTQALNEFLAVFTSVRQTTRESAETIATGLRTIFTRIQREDTIEALRQYGISLTDVEGKFVGAYKAVQLLSEGLGGLDPRDLRFSQIVEELGGFRQIGKVIPLIQQFSVAQEALGVAQRGQGSLAKDAAVAQLGLANQIKKVREEFTALMRSVGAGDAFQTLSRTALGFASSIIKVADSIKGVLPVLAILGLGAAARGASRFGTGFVAGLKKDKGGGGGDGGLGGGGGGLGSPMNSGPTRDLSILDDILKLNTQAIDSLSANITGLSTSLGQINAFSAAIQANTASLTSNTASLQALTSAISSMNLGGGSAAFNAGGAVKKFARGGIVPGTGNTDTVPAMLMPGEFVIRKKAVETIGADNLHNMNKYGGGGSIISGRGGKRKRFAGGGAVKIEEIKGIKRVKDGDSFIVTAIPEKESFEAEFRIADWDAYETIGDSPRSRKTGESIVSKNKYNKILKLNKNNNDYVIPPETIVTEGGITSVMAGNIATSQLQRKLQNIDYKKLQKQIIQGQKDRYDRLLIKSSSGLLDIDDELKTGRTFGYNFGGRVQKFMTGGKAQPKTSKTLDIPDAPAGTSDVLK
jgi:CII-binding regulator of phage lambda lysogenization HflD